MRSFFRTITDLQRLKYALLNAFARWFFTGEKRERFYKKLAALIKNKVDKLRAIERLYHRAKRYGTTSPRYMVLEHVYNEVREGKKLSEALAPYVPDREVQLIAAGEQSARLGKNLEFVAETIGYTAEMKESVQNAVAMPIVLFGGIIGIIYFIGYTVIPTMADVSDPSGWSGAARGLYLVSEFVQSAWALTIPGVFLVLVVGLYLSMETTLYGSLRVYLDKIPPWSFYRMIVGSSFLLSLSALMKAGTSLYDALELMRSNASPYMEKRIDAALRELRGEAENIGDALDRTGYEFPDWELIDDMALFSQLQNFEEVLYDFGEDWIERATAQVKTYATMLNIFAYTVLGLTVGWVVWAMFAIQNTIRTTAM